MDIDFSVLGRLELCINIFLWTETNMFNQEGPAIHEMVMWTISPSGRAVGYQ